MSSTIANPEQPQIEKYFNTITKKYDLLNTILSLGLDRLWRRTAVRALMQRQPTDVLDIGAGTGRMVEELLNQSPSVAITGIDVAEEMLKLASHRIQSGSVAWRVASGLNLPFEDQVFNGAMTAFTLRSIQKLDVFFQEVYRVLQPGSRFVILELTRPPSQFMRFFHQLYVRFFVPLVGRLLSQDKEAYAFLSHSVLKFEEPANIADKMHKAGFKDVQVNALSGGIVHLIIGDRRD